MGDLPVNLAFYPILSIFAALNQTIKWNTTKLSLSPD